MKKLTIEIDGDIHTQFKSKAAADRLVMGDIIRWAVADYIAGRWKPRPYDRQAKKNEKPMK